MSARKTMLKFYWFCQRRILPDLRYSQYNYEELLNKYVDQDTCWLDTGCGRMILPSWRCKQEDELVKRCHVIVGIDSDTSAIGRHLNIKTILHHDLSNPWPIEDSTFDLITCNMVLEHLSEPQVFFNECYRILRPGGRVIIHTPNKDNYAIKFARLIPESIKDKLVRILDGRSGADVYPTLYRANSVDEIDSLAASAGFINANFEIVNSTPKMAVIPPLMLIELLYIRRLSHPRRTHKRHNILAVLKK